MSQAEVSTHPEQRAAETGRRYRLLVLASHVIHVDGPWYQNLAAHPEVDLTVLYGTDWGIRTPPKGAGYGRKATWDRPMLEGYRYEFLPNWSHSDKPPHHLLSLFNPGVVRWISAGKFDAVLVNGWVFATNWMAMLTAFRCGVPVLLRGDSNNLQSPPGLKGWLKGKVLSGLFRRASGFLVSGRYNADFYRGYGGAGEKIFATPYCVDNHFFLAEADKLAGEQSRLKQRLGVGADTPLIIFCGRLSEIKRPMDLLRAFHRASSHHRAALLYVGDGPLRQELEIYIRDHQLQGARLLGFRNQSELPAVFAAADIFVLPSDFEPWGLVVNEAMCFGLPVVASDKVGATGDLVKTGTNGFVYPATDVEALSDALERLLRDPELRQRMGRASRQMIETWSYREATAGVVRCLEWLAESKAHRGTKR